ncbi:MAG: cell envelope-related transcriptional attenuator [Firmicutes bacterium]|nr:cell envelope-related transcriptional attenuator [Bacillota bacterium]
MSRLCPQRRKIRWKRLFFLLFILIALLASLSWAAVYTYKKFSSAPVFSTNVQTNKRSDPTGPYINILLMGVDDGDNEHPDAPKRSDTMIVANINKENGVVNLLSIPRDTRVTIQGHKGAEKITHAFFYGGPSLAVQTVEQLLQIPIHYYIVVDWQAFIEIVDTLGGVDLYVENDMNYEDPYAHLAIHLSKGYQHLDGSKSGQYVRFRSDELGDIGRVQRQQRFLKAMVEKTMNVGTLLKVPYLLNTINQYVTTDISTFKMLKLANSLKLFKAGGLHADMLPGNFATNDGISFWRHDSEQTKQLINRIFIGENAKMSGIFPDSISNN